MTDNSTTKRRYNPFKLKNRCSEKQSLIQYIMFENPFSFEGRIRRTEYGISSIIYLVVAQIINAIAGNSFLLLVLAYIPMLWFILAQGAKRCHDRGNSGWFQIIPFYIIWLLFAEGDNGTNEYGSDPKATLIKETSNNTPEENLNLNEYKNGIVESVNTDILTTIEESNNLKTNTNEIVNKPFIPKKKPIHKKPI